jgi:hypothetical protein
MRMVVIDGDARVSIVDGASATPLVVAIDADGVPQLHDAHIEPLELQHMEER